MEPAAWPDAVAARQHHARRLVLHSTCIIDSALSSHPDHVDTAILGSACAYSSRYLLAVRCPCTKQRFEDSAKCTMFQSLTVDLSDVD
mgnify:FL=1|jgi:hypothetical protein